MQDDNSGMSVAEAAARLGVTTDAVRKRIQRGTLQGHKVGRRWFVVLDSQDATTGKRPESDPTGSLSADRQGLVAALQGEVAFLREEVVRKDHIIAALTQRIPLLPPPGKQRPWWQFWRQDRPQV